MDLLSTDEEVMHEFQRRSPKSPPLRRRGALGTYTGAERRSSGSASVDVLPIAAWIRFRADLAPYLTTRRSDGLELLGFYHRSLADSARERFCNASDAPGLHLALANYFDGRTPLRPSERWSTVTGEATGPTRRVLTELIYQLTRAKAEGRLAEVVGNAQFLRARCEAHSVFALLSDLDDAFAASNHRFECVRGALRDAVPSLQSSPELTVQDLFNRLRWLPASSDPAVLGAVAAMRAELERSAPWISAELPFPKSGLIEGHTVELLTRPVASWVSSSGDRVAVVDHDGTFEERTTSSGAVVTRLHVQNRLRNVGRTGDAGVVVWQNDDGHVGSRNRMAPIQSAGRAFAATAQLGAVYASVEGTLVSWIPGAAACPVLLPLLPTPCRLLRETRHGEHVLFVAGQHPQQIGLISAGRADGPTRIIVFEGPPIIDADYDATRDECVVATRDHRLRLIHMDTGEVHAEIAYEQAGLGIVGAPAGCAFGTGPFSSWAFAVTTDGALFGWHLETQVVRKVRALWSKEAPSELLILRVVASTGHVLIVTADQIWVGGLDSESPDASQQRSSVTDIVIDAAGGIVSAARQTDALLWHDPDPLGLASRQWVVKPTALLSWNRDREVVVGTSRGSVWRQPPDVTVKESFDLFSTPVKALAPGLARDSVVAAASDGRILELSFATEHATLIDQGIGSRSLLCLAYREMERMYVAVSFDETILDPVDMMTATLRTQYRLDMLRQLRGTLVRTYPDRGHPTIVHIDPSHRRLAAVSADGAWLCLAGSTLALFRFEREHLTPAAVRNLTVEHMTFLGTSPAHLVIAVDGSWIEVLELTPELPVLARCKVPSLISSLCTVASRIACGLSDGRIVSLQFHPTVR